MKGWIVLKGLAQFRQFDWEGFAKGKTFQVTALGEWLDHDTGRRLGRRVEVVIVADNTQYDFRRGEEFTNLFEKLVLKVEGSSDVSIGAAVAPIDVTAKCYGDYQNQLSVVCKSLRIVSPTVPSKGQN